MEKIFKCSIEYTLSFIGGKWKPIILWHLGTEGIHRYSELRKKLGQVTHKMLSQQLKELEYDGLIIRKAYPQIPPKVEYSLSEKGKTLLPILDQMCQWGNNNYSFSIHHQNK